MNVTEAQTTTINQVGILSPWDADGEKDVWDAFKDGLTELGYPEGKGVTGVATMSWKLSRPRLALLNELMPSARKVALIRHSANVALDLQVGETRTASSQLGIDLVVFELGGAQELEGAFSAAKQQGASAMMALSDPMAANNSDTIVSLSFKYRIPVVSPYMHMAKAGAVLAYGPNRALLYRRAASLVARVLKGANPGDLPIEQPNQFDLVINIKSAQSFGLPVPDALLARATHVVR